MLHTHLQSGTFFHISMEQNYNLILSLSLIIFSVLNIDYIVYNYKRYSPPVLKNYETYFFEKIETFSIKNYLKLLHISFLLNSLSQLKTNCMHFVCLPFIFCMYCKRGQTNE